MIATETCRDGALSPHDVEREPRCAELALGSLTIRDTATIAHALGHPVRLEIIEQLARSPLVAGDIARNSGLARSTISEHLRILREACIVLTHRDGPRVCYHLDPHTLQALSTQLDDIVEN